jgi:hypothetical protein
MHMERFGRSWDLLKACFAVLRDDKELMLFPVLSGFSALLVLATFALPLFFTQAFSHGFGLFGMLVAFAFYFSQYLVIFYFNAALVGAALKRLEGGDPTFADGIAIANENISAILGYAAIAATVGMLLRGGRRRRGLEALVRSLAGMAWTLGTFLVVPVLVTRKIGPIDAITESARLLKKTWGENLIGSAGIWLGFGIMTFLYILVSAVLVVLAAKAGTVFAVALGAVLLLGLLLIGVVKSAIKAIYTAVLYRYAAEGAAPEGFDAQQLSLAFGAR